MRGVTYGPLPGGWPEDFREDFSRMRAAGINVVRLFSMPDKSLLDEATVHGLQVFAGLEWGQNADFISQPGLFTAAKVHLQESLREIGHHPALAGLYVGNEIPADLARWMGAVSVREAIEELISIGRELAPWLMFAYANYPSTEYLEPENADFTAMNVYLEDPQAYRRYLKKLHHLAGDRPVVISEFGLDSQRNGAAKQAEVLGWAHAISLEEEAAGFTIFSWSDRWQNGSEEVMDWDFGLIDRENAPKPALETFQQADPEPPRSEPLISVIVCTRNGRWRIGACLLAILKMTDRNFEIIVVDDGSDDQTSELIEAQFPWVNLLTLEPCGLSAARNTGAAAAKGEILAFTDDDCEPDSEWVTRLRRIYEKGYAAVGGPNLPPAPKSWQEAIVCASPGAPSHVMLDDEEAEHLPGCNLTVNREAFNEIGGFDPIFRTAGDDVDFCWRLRDAGHRLGFAPGAFVWHWRRPSVWAFLRQQIGYGHAERLLLAKHPGKFSKEGNARWEGFIYGGGPVRAIEGSVIYHGTMGQAGYQSVINRMLPLRGLDGRFDNWKTQLIRKLVSFFQPRIRAWARSKRFLLSGLWNFNSDRPELSSVEEFSISSHGSPVREDFLQTLLSHGWTPGGATDDWDLEKHGTRVLMATEHGYGKGKRTLFRVWGKRSAVEPLLRSVPGTFK